MSLELDVRQVFRVFVTWTHQKNGNHGERKLFVRNDTTPARCMLRAVLRILRRFVRLVGERRDIPVAVFQPSARPPVYLSESRITSVMRMLATTVYGVNFSDPTMTDRWSSHSLRVGACLLLHSLGFTAPQIKFILRWKSDSFMEYLRNVALLSSRQNDAVSLLEHMPNVI
jgi:hypothetical protein